MNSLNAAPLKKTFFSFSDHLASWVSVCWFLRLPKVDLCCKALPVDPSYLQESQALVKGSVDLLGAAVVAEDNEL